MKKLRIAVLEHYPDIAKALNVSDDDKEKIFYHLAINEAGNGCSVYFRAEVFDEVSPHLIGGEKGISDFPCFNFQVAKAYDILDRLRLAFALHVDFLKAGEIRFLLD